MPVYGPSRRPLHPIAATALFVATGIVSAGAVAAVLLGAAWLWIVVLAAFGWQL